MCDLDQSRLQHLQNLYPAVEGTTDFKHMLNGVDLDAVVIATPVKYHHPLAKQSLLAGKHTFIEKPMASSSAECEELIEIAEKKGLTLMIGHTFLYSSPVRKIVEIIKAGDIGEIRSINSRRLNLGLFQPDINVAWDLAPHDISIVLHILGESPLVVNCQGNAPCHSRHRGCDQSIADLQREPFRFHPKQLAGTQEGARNDDRRDAPDDRL